MNSPNLKTKIGKTRLYQTFNTFGSCVKWTKTYSLTFCVTVLSTTTMTLHVFITVHIFNHSVVLRTNCVLVYLRFADELIANFNLITPLTAMIALNFICTPILFASECTGRYFTVEKFQKRQRLAIVTCI